MIISKSFKYQLRLTPQQKSLCNQTIITSTHYPQLLKTKKSKISAYLVKNGKIKVWQ
ncbi:hypothetical protein ES707_16442 [subsurface metagenome]